MRVTSISTILAIALVACGGHGSTGDDGGPGDDGNGGGDDGNGHGTTNVTVTMNNQPTNAAMFSFVVAYQDGSGPWQAAPPPTGDVYTLPINSGVWGFAWSCIGTPPGVGQAQQRQVTDIHFSIAERTSYTIDVPPRCSDRDTGNVLLKGTISNANGGGVYVVRFGDRFVQAGVTGNYQMPVQPGTHDLIVAHGMLTAIGNDFVADQVFVQRDLAVAAATTANVDWNNAADVQSFAVTGTGLRLAATTLYSKGGTTAVLVNDTTSQFETEATAAAQSVAGDIYDQVMAAGSNGQTGITTLATTTPAAETFTAPTPLGGATSTTMATPYPRITTTWAAYANAIGYVWTATQQPGFVTCGNTPCTATWTGVLSAGVIGAMPTYTMPDLSAIPGWNTALQFVAATQVAGSVQAMTSSAGGTDFPPATPPAVGTQRTFVRSDYTVTP